MTGRERWKRIFKFQEVDRIFNCEFGWWTDTLKKWHKEGLSENWDNLKKEWENRDYPLGIPVGSLFGWIRNWMGFENYLVSFDHRVPPDVSFENYLYYLKRKKEIFRIDDWEIPE